VTTWCRGAVRACRPFCCVVESVRQNIIKKPMPLPIEPAVLSPFVERVILEEHLPKHFITTIKNEINRQKKEIKLNKLKHIQIDLNKLYDWREDMPTNSYNLLRKIVMSKSTTNPVLANDIAAGYLCVVGLASEEYWYQKQQVKLGLRKHIQVDFNLLYC